MAEKIEVILVDMGNTAIKSAEVIDGEILNHTTWKSVADLRQKYSSVPTIISSVRADHEALLDLFSGSDDLVLNHKTKLPIVLDYETPETLGADRIALAVGANTLYPNQDNLIIDMGTCVTIDLIDRKGTYKGGSISPGLTMRMKAMAEYTGGLPDISQEWENIEARRHGKSTKEGLLHGSYFGLLNEINGSIETFRQDFASLNIILTGGDAHFFDSRIKAHIFAGSKIVEIGLYRIWKLQ